MKSINKKLCRNNEAVSEVIGGLLLITIVITLMTALMIIATNYIDMQKEIARSTMDAVQQFMDELKGTSPPTEPGHNPGHNNTAPEIKDPYPADGATGVDLKPNCSVKLCDEDGDILAYQFF